MRWHQYLADGVRKDFERAKRENPKTSLRGYSRSIQTPVSTVSEILHGKINVGDARASEIVERLGLSANETSYLLTLIGKAPKSTRTSLDQSKFELVTDWVYLAVLHFFDLDVEDKSAGHIAARLGVAAAKVRCVIADLVAWELLRAGEDGSLEATGMKWQTGDGPTSLAIRAHHHENLKLAARALDLVPAPQRDFSSTTMAGSLEQIELIREEIRKLHDKIEAICEGASKKDRVYKLSVGFFPVDITEGH